MGSLPITKPKSHKIKRPSFKQLPTFKSVQITSKYLITELSDGRIVSVPLSWSKPLTKATEKQRQAFEITGYNLFWDEIDEIIGVENILYGSKLFL